MTLRMRPRVSGPTGIMIGSPVSTAWAPRTSPSVVSIAIVRTVFSPRCCATSSTSLLPACRHAARCRIAGSSPSNCTSTTGADDLGDGADAVSGHVQNALVSSWRDNQTARLGAGDDLDQLLGDGGLARAVIVQGQPVDHVAGVAGGVVHRGHPRALLARGVFEERRVDLHREVARQQLGQDLLLVRLELVDRAAAEPRRAVLGRRRGNGISCCAVTIWVIAERKRL